MRFLFVFLVVIVVAVLGGYLYWMTTPYYAFQQAGLSVAGHDLKQFNDYVDSESLIASSLDQALFTPIEATQGLTVLQQKVVGSAVALTRPVLTKALHEQVEAYVSGLSNSTLPAAGVSQEVPPAPKGAIGKLLSEIKEEEMSRLSKAAHEKMINFSATHADTLVGQMIGMSRDERKQKLKSLLARSGFTPENFKGFTMQGIPSQVGETCHVLMRFQKPDSKEETSVGVEMQKSGSAAWRIVRFVQLHDVLVAIEPGYDSEIQALVQCAVHGIGTGELASEAKHLIQSRPAVQLMQAVRSRLTGGGPGGAQGGAALKSLGNAMKNSDSGLRVRDRFQRFKTRMDSPAQAGR